LKLEKDTILLYADGACFPNPGNMAIGVVLYYNGHTKEYSQQIGQGTNNIAELAAIQAGLGLIKNDQIPVIVVSDSQYALNCIAGKFNPSKNVEIISQIQSMVSQFKSVKFRWVRGHSGDRYNARADYLSNQYFKNSYDL
jgi:ribonuclease HI